MITKKYDLKEGNKGFKGLLFSQEYLSKIIELEEKGQIKHIRSLKLFTEKVPYSIFFGNGSVAELEERDRAIVHITGEDEDKISKLKINIEYIISNELIPFNPLNYKEHSN